jgi:hypothetical protein
MQIQSGIQVSLDGVTWYKLTDHNRDPFKIAYEVIDKTSRMADGTMRRYVVARKHKITSSWKSTTSWTPDAVDYNAVDPTTAKAGAWIKAFYEANVFNPVYVKIINAGETIPSPGSYPDETTYYSSQNAATDTDNKTYLTYITAFDYEVVKRSVGGINATGRDLVNITIEFTEV